MSSDRPSIHFMPVDLWRAAVAVRAAGDKCRGRTIFFTMTTTSCEVFNAGEALRNAVEQIESGNDEAEIRYDGLKYLPSVLFIKY